MPNRPAQVKRAIVLLWISFLAGTVLSFLDMDPAVFAENEYFPDWLFGAIFVAWLLAYAALIHLTYLGRNWARIAMFVLYAAGLAVLLYFGTASDDADVPVFTLSDLGFFALDGIALYWLSTGEGGAWYSRKGRRDTGRVCVDADGFTSSTAGGPEVHIAWSAVHTISVFKLDLFTTDEVRVHLELDQAPFAVELSEETPGFEGFARALEKRFDFPEGWWRAAVQPAFEANRRVLYRRA